MAEQAPGQTPPPEDDQARAAQWAQDRITEEAPLPHSNLPHYEHDSQRQTDLAAAEKSNIARAAGELGLTTAEWEAKRKELGRSPNRGDIK